MATDSSSAIRSTIYVMVFHLSSGFLKIASIAPDTMSHSPNQAPMPANHTASQAAIGA